MLGPHQIQILGAVGYIWLIFILREVLFEKVHLSLVIVNQKCNDVMKADQPLDLGLLVRCQHHQVQILLIDNLDSVWNFRVDIEVDKLRFFVVGLAQRPLNFKPVLKCDVVKDLEN
jgi:hypothetical protein